MIDSDPRPLLISASTDVNISNHGPILGYSNWRPFKTLISIGSFTQYKFAIKNNCNDSFVFLLCFLSIFPFLNIISKGRIYFGGPRKSDIVINKAHDP
jgi:hypothetical protein